MHCVVHCTLCSVVQCTLHCAVYSVQCPVCSACLGVIVQCTVHQCAVLCSAVHFVVLCAMLCNVAQCCTVMRSVVQCASPNCSIGLCEKQPLAPTHLYLETHHHHLHHQDLHHHLHHQDLHNHYYNHEFIFNIITKVFIITIISSDITFKPLPQSYTMQHQHKLPGDYVCRVLMNKQLIIDGQRNDPPASLRILKHKYKHKQLLQSPSLS